MSRLIYVVRKLDFAACTKQRRRLVWAMRSLLSPLLFIICKLINQSLLPPKYRDVDLAALPETGALATRHNKAIPSRDIT